MIISLKKFDFKNDGLQIFTEPKLLDTGFQELATAVFGSLSIGTNAVNQLKRGIRWGVLMNETICWVDRTTYSLPTELNSQENGNIRNFTLLPREFVEHPVLAEVIYNSFVRMSFNESSKCRAYEIQLSAIRYEVSHSESALPSPIYPHQDSVDGSVIVVNECNVSKAINRIYTVSNEPLYEFVLAPSEGFLLKDSEYKHQVVPLVYQADRWPENNLGFRDIIILRFQPLGR